MKKLYEQKVIPSLKSCLTDVIETAIERFEQMGLLEFRFYANKKGTSTVFLQSPAESEKKVTETLDMLS